MAMTPVRVRRGSAWVPVDTTLELTPKGVVAKALVQPVVLSPGGGGR
jgi:hypothetical protein